MNIDPRYQIVEKAGSGGMATVFRARDTVLNRDVAIKVLHPHLVEKEEVKKRFLREAQAIARLRHRNIIEVYDYKSTQEDCYIISEFIKGESLANFLSEYDISSPFISAMIVTVLSDAIAHAHKNGVIHRDIKPENILISDNRLLKITDFGIAHITDAESLTITGSISGSPAHMSPEQIDGKGVDERTDIFSLGTLLYLISTGELPFKGTSPAAIFKAILMGEYREPRELNPLIDNRFSSILQKTLKKNLNERYSSTTELRDDLTEYLRSYGIVDIETMLAELFTRPIEFMEELNQRIIRHLKDYLYKNISTKKENAEIRDYLNILLHLAPEDSDALALFDRFTSLANRVERRIRFQRASLGMIIVLLLTIPIYLLIRHKSETPIFGTSDTVSQDIFTRDGVEDVSSVSTISQDRPTENASNESGEELKKEIAPRELKKERKRIIQIANRKVVSQKSIPVLEQNEKYGEIRLFIKPYGDVYIDNTLYAREKAAANIKLPGGQHRLVIKNPFYFDIEKEITITGNSTTDLRLVFDRIKPAKLIINSTAECDIYIDGNLLGRSDAYMKNGITIPINSKDGKRQILFKATRDGYNDFVRNIELTAGETKALKINLTPKSR